MAPARPSPLPPGSIIGILGGGQLGRMIALAAARFGYRCHIFTPEEDAPAAQVSERCTLAEWNDHAALEEFGAACDVVTYEFENIPAGVAEDVGRRVPVRPDAGVLATCQDRISEKRFLSRIGIPTTRWQAADSQEGFVHAVEEIGRPSVLKSARLGYDGKGQVAIGEDADLARAWAEMVGETGTTGVVEAWVDFQLELSVIVARSQVGDMATYVPVENQHENHILRRTVVPAPIAPTVADAADKIARNIAAELGLVGVLAVEMFVRPDGGLLVNELAPRPHNSGHWTIDACACSQFEQCVRAVAGLPLGPTDRNADAVMENLLGSEVDRWRDLAGDRDARLHLYGKREARPGRKMGHVTRLFLRG
jgi:5-(carboxyamino)imidazole ribonucleotide synthase